MRKTSIAMQSTTPSEDESSATSSISTFTQDRPQLTKSGMVECGEEGCNIMIVDSMDARKKHKDNNHKTEGTVAGMCLSLCCYGLF